MSCRKSCSIQARFAKLAPVCETAARFTLAWSEVRPLDRLRLVHGSAATMAGLGGESKELRAMLDRLHDLFCRELELWSKTGVDGVVFCDDLGWQDDPRLSPKIWRSICKPLYKQYCEILRRNDKFVFFSSDGHLGDFLDDLIEIGVDAVHAAWYRMDFEHLAAKHRGEVAFWGDFSGKAAEPASLPEVRDLVMRARKALDFGSGGVIAQCPWGVGMPLRTIATFFEQWMIPLPVSV